MPTAAQQARFISAAVAGSSAADAIDEHQRGDDLFAAIFRGDRDRLRLLLLHGASPTRTCPQLDNATPIHAAASAGDLVALMALVSCVAARATQSIADCPTQPVHPLQHDAADQRPCAAVDAGPAGGPAEARLVLRDDRSAFDAVPGQHGRRATPRVLQPLSHAPSDVQRMLIGQRAVVRAVHQRTGSGHTPLLIAARAGHLAVCMYLTTQAGARVDHMPCSCAYGDDDDDACDLGGVGVGGSTGTGSTSLSWPSMMTATAWTTAREIEMDSLVSHASSGMSLSPRARDNATAASHDRSHTGGGSFGPHAFRGMSSSGSIASDHQSASSARQTTQANISSSSNSSSGRSGIANPASRRRGVCVCVCGGVGADGDLGGNAVHWFAHHGMTDAVRALALLDSAQVRRALTARRAQDGARPQQVAARRGHAATAAELAAIEFAHRAW